MENIFVIDDNITIDDIDYIEKWLENNDFFYRNINIIKDHFNDGTFLLYRNKGKADGFITYLGIDKKIIVEIICIKQDLRHKGIGRGFVNDYIEYFKKRNILVVEIDNVITSEGNNLCISTGFKKLVKPNEEDITQFYKPLTRDCRKENWTANRRIVLWKKESFDSSCPPDMSWDLDFKNDKAPILEYAYKDWYVGIVENNQIIEYGKVKYFYGVANETLGYIYINNDIFRR